MPRQLAGPRPRPRRDGRRSRARRRSRRPLGEAARGAEGDQPLHAQSARSRKPARQQPDRRGVDERRGRGVQRQGRSVRRLEVELRPSAVPVCAVPVSRRAAGSALHAAARAVEQQGHDVRPRRGPVAPAGSRPHRRSRPPASPPQRPATSEPRGAAARATASAANRSQTPPPPATAAAADTRRAGTCGSSGSSRGACATARAPGGPRLLTPLSWTTVTCGTNSTRQPARRKRSHQSRSSQWRK